MDYDAVIVGGGLSGLTAAAYLTKYGKSVLLVEKEPLCGGLINSFERDGFIYDGGIRALENSGVLFPMLRQLGISLDFLPNKISIGIEDRIINIETDESAQTYKTLLKDLYPSNHQDIEQIFQQIVLIMHYMDVQYGIDNPMFLDLKKDQEYLVKKILPWMFKYAFTAPKISKLNEPVVDFLRHFTNNQSLLDIITQHFFEATPAFFALSYLKLFMDYHYPKGGTGKFIGKLVDFIKEHHGEISNNTQIVEIDTDQRFITDSHGITYHYRRLIWAADLVTMYQLLKRDNTPKTGAQRVIEQAQKYLSTKKGNDSVFTMFVGVNLAKDYFASKCTEHFFYTPSREGQSIAGPLPINKDRKEIEDWLDKFLSLTSYEISIPAMRDETLAPEGKTGLIVSFLFDYKLTKYIEEQGWYDAFKLLCEKKMVAVLDDTVFPGIKASIQHVFSSSPLTLAKLTGNHEGAITGWSYTNKPIPAESRLPKIMQAIKTPIPGIYQAGQWTYSPSGLPISLLTGKIAADQVLKDLK